MTEKLLGSGGATHTKDRHAFGDQRHASSPEPTTAPNVVVGLGNEIAGDDGAGIEVTRILGIQLADSTDIDVVALPWAGFALLDVLRGRKRAAIVDCLTTGNHPPGTIVLIDETDLAGSVRLNSFHDISYPTVMALGRRLGWGMPDTIAIWGIEAASFGTFTEELSPAVAAAIHEVARQVRNFLTSPYSAQRVDLARDGPCPIARE
ncbi:MAG: hydrogenase maturation protease [bacterium]|nr:hydrogenase maturation protease [bacterium]